MFPRNLSNGTEGALASLARLVLQSSFDGFGALAPVQACTIGEVFLDDLIGALIRSSGLTSNRFHQRLLDSVRLQIFGSWDGRLDWLRDGFGLSLAGEKPVQDFRVLNELRNAIVHGNFALTDLQLRGQRRNALESNLQKVLKVSVRRRELKPSVDTAMLAVRTAREFTLFVNAQVAETYPRLTW